MAKSKRKYSVYQIKGCNGGAYNQWISSTDDINLAHKRVEATYDRILATKNHSQGGYWDCPVCWRDRNTNRKCKGKFEVRENW